MSNNNTPVTLDVVRGWFNGGFHDFLQMSLIEYNESAGVLRIALPFKEAYSRLPDIGDYHGGVLSALLDVVGTFLAALATKGAVATSNLRTDFLRPAVNIDLVASASIVRVGRSAIIVDAEICDESGRQYAVARGTWMPVALRRAG